MKDESQNFWISGCFVNLSSILKSVLFEVFFVSSRHHFQWGLFVPLQYGFIIVMHSAPTRKTKSPFFIFWIIKVASSEIYVWKLLILITKYYQQQWGIIVMYQISQAGKKFNSKRRLTKSNFFIYLNLENKLRFCNYSFFPIDCFCVHYSSRIHYFDCSFQIYWFKIIILLPSPSWQIDHDKS